MSYLDELNAQQKEAVTTTEGPVLVIAGAGSGKTRVIEYRVAHLLKQGVSPRSILLLTFTRKAAGEMLRRASRHDASAEHVDGGTFHSFAFKMLRRYGERIGLSGSLSVLDEGDAEEAVHRSAASLGLYDPVNPAKAGRGTSKEGRFPKKDTLRSVISASLNKGLDISSILMKDYPHFLHLADDIARVGKRYAAYKREKGYMDYDDLLLFLRELLMDKETLAQLSEQYRYVMVDEYQDTNVLQGDIAYLLGKKNQNVMAVGDDAQSIYGFRGATHENIMNFPKRFPNTTIIKLEENYRSTQEILNVANAVLSDMDNKYAKKLHSAKKEGGGRPHFVCFEQPYREAEWIARKIKEFYDEGVSLSRQAVLFRSSHVSIPLQAELAKRIIPFQVFGGVKFYETAHAKDVMAHLKILLNPRDELAWNRVLMLIPGIGPKTGGRLIAEIIRSVSEGRSPAGVLSSYAKQSRDGREIEKLASFLEASFGKPLPPSEQFALAFSYYEPLLWERFDDWHKRLNDLQTLQQVSSRYASLQEFLGDFVIEPPSFHQAGMLSRPEERPLTLSTIHSAKGLEWDVVFFLGLSEGVLPSNFSMNREDEIEEERRLFYVGVTRAKRNLYLLANFGAGRGGEGAREPSRFVTSSRVLLELNQFGLSPSSYRDSEDEDEESVEYDDDGIGAVRKRKIKD